MSVARYRARCRACGPSRWLTGRPHCLPPSVHLLPLTVYPATRIIRVLTLAAGLSACAWLGIPAAPWWL